MSYRLAIFDFDGVLADSAPWVMGVFNSVADRFGFRRVTDAEIEQLRGCDNRAIIRSLGVPAWKLPMIAAHMRRRMAEDAAAIPLFKGAPAMLRALSARGVTLGIVSSNSEANVRTILGPELAGLIRRYDCGAALFGKAAKLKRVQRRTGVDPASVICIGDESRDIEAAAQAGFASGAATWGYAKAELLASCRPTLLFASIDEIPERIAFRA